MEKNVFDFHKGQFLTTGMLSRNLLKCLWYKFNLTDDDLEGMIELIKANNHCFEDEQKEHQPFEDEQKEHQLPSMGRLLRFPWFIKKGSPKDWLSGNGLA